MQSTRTPATIIFVLHFHCKERKTEEALPDKLMQTSGMGGRGNEGGVLGVFDGWSGLRVTVRADEAREAGRVGREGGEMKADEK